jgi:hypothetical protein
MAGKGFMQINGLEYEFASPFQDENQLNTAYGRQVRGLIGGHEIQIFDVLVNGVQTHLRVAPQGVFAAALYFMPTPEPNVY